MSIHRDLTQAAEDLLRALTVVDVRVAAMRDAQNGQPGAQRFGVRGGGSVLMCWTHEVELPSDGRERQAPCDEFCVGENIDVADPTGEAAMKPDRAAQQLRRLETLARKAKDAAADIVSLLAAEQPNVATNERAGIGVCEACGKYVDGAKDRLRPSLNKQHRYCNACRMREARFKAAAS